MKTRRAFITTAATLALVALPGCALLNPNATVKEKAAQAQALAYSASSIGVSVTLELKPMTKPAFLLAYTNLNALVESGQITGQTLRDIVKTLPVQELTSPIAKIIVDNASMLFDLATGKPVDLNSAPIVLGVATGIRDGMRVALGIPIPMPKPPAPEPPKTNGVVKP